MKRFSLATAGAGLGLALMAAPFAAAQQYQQPPAHDQSHEQSRPQTPAPPHQMSGMAHPPGHSPMPPPHPTMQARHEQPRPPVHMVQGSHQWHSGDRFGGTRRPVSNWRHYHLRQPPQGYEWVQDGSQFVLIAVASGVIADVILNSGY